MSATKVLDALKKKDYKPVYLLHGEEAFFIDQISDFIEENVLDPSQRGFDQTVLYGKDTDMVTIVNAARRFPMLASHQVLIVKEAQNLKWKTEEEVLLKYLENPMPSTILVIAHKYAKIDKRKKLYKVAEKIGVAFESEKIYETKIAAWVTSYLAHQGRKIHPQASALIGEYLGTDLSRVVNELEKLMLNVPADQEITLKHIEQFIGISKDFNAFEFCTAIGMRNSVKAYRIGEYFASNPNANPFVMVLGVVTNYFTKILKFHYAPDKSPTAISKELGIHNYFVSEYEEVARNFNRRKAFDAISILREYDLKSKGVGATDINLHDLYKEMIYRLILISTRL